MTFQKGDDYIAVTMVDVENRQLGPGRVVQKQVRTDAPFTLLEKKLLRSVLLNLNENLAATDVRLAYDDVPEPRYEKTNGIFACSAMGDLDGSGNRKLIYGISLDCGVCYLFAVDYAEGVFRQELIAHFTDRKVSFIRTIAVGDVDGRHAATVQEHAVE